MTGRTADMRNVKDPTGSMTARVSELTWPQLLGVYIALQAVVLSVIAFAFRGASVQTPDDRFTLLTIHLNVWHLIVHLVMGVTAMVCLHSAKAARWWALTAGVVSLSWAVLGVVQPGQTLGFVEDDGLGALLHGIEGVALVLVAVMAGKTSLARR